MGCRCEVQIGYDLLNRDASGGGDGDGVGGKFGGVCEKGGVGGGHVFVV